ncbi:MAG: hypothetical protein JJ953_07165 [Gracilimonas sp.]|uniref:hypothetical protein n=1 Tax=Gracilimonas TaxID=649462 RepID=UPI001B2E5DF4|nr:hypothetical protein [Gracilimonas sp.]MBO6585869.1 hypothetical protein [Gracilimonas sp.]MBO6616866.1 hypothetical protein [Gracilimonas sp.]
MKNTENTPSFRDYLLDPLIRVLSCSNIAWNTDNTDVMDGRWLKYNRKHPPHSAIISSIPSSVFHSFHPYSITPFRE